MRVIAKRTLIRFWETEPLSEQSLRAWHDEVRDAEWKTPNELKTQFRTASVINQKRVVFNIHGNEYRLIVDIEYRLKIVFIVWVGTHKQYDKIDVKNVRYVATDKKQKTIRRRA